MAIFIMVTLELPYGQAKIGLDYQSSSLKIATIQSNIHAKTSATPPNLSNDNSKSLTLTPTHPPSNRV